MCRHSNVDRAFHRQLIFVTAGLWVGFEVSNLMGGHVIYIGGRALDKQSGLSEQGNRWIAFKVVLTAHNLCSVRLSSIFYLHNVR